MAEERSRHRWRDRIQLVSRKREHNGHGRLYGHSLKRFRLLNKFARRGDGDYAAAAGPSLHAAASFNREDRRLFAFVFRFSHGLSVTRAAMA